MVGEITLLSEWIPEQMGPGTIFVLENAGDMGDTHDPYWAVLACPECGVLGLVTRKQVNGVIPILCGSETCAAQYFLKDDDKIVARKPS